MKSMDLGLLSAGVALALALGGAVPVLAGVEAPDRWPRNRAPEPPPAQRLPGTPDHEAQVRELNERAAAARRQKRALYEASQPGATCAPLMELYVVYDWNEADALATQHLEASRCWLRIEDLRVEARARRLEHWVDEVRAGRAGR